uniref:VG15 protein n=1 Tax=Gemmiger formicilis TaxID=745368 RepID=UPI004025C217
MQITANAWNEYITRLSRLNQKAGQLMREYIGSHGTESTDDLIAYAYGLVTKYGEGSAELACQMYDALAEAANAGVPAAEPAEPADYGEVARMVNATKNQNPANLPNGVSRLVKRAGADTTLKNAVRDGAEWAWVPHGDTCPFCITLASNGWQKASSKVLKGGHADHIHANCDCEFAIRFDHSTTLAGYDPEKYLKQYRDAGGDINKMRRIDYAARKDAINAQKRAAYAVRKVNKSERSYSGGVGSNKADLDYMNSAPYRAKFDSVSDNPALNQSIYKYCKAAVTHQSGDYYEDLSILRMDGSLVGQTSSKVRNETQYSRTLNAAVKSAEPYSLVSLHNHGTNVPPSGADFGSAGEKKYAFGIVACHDGTIYKYSTRNARPFAVSVIDKKVDIYMAPPYNMGVINA